MIKRLLDALFPRKPSTNSADSDAKDDDRLVLVFIPPLVTILAAAEESKGSPLSEAECTSIRDKSVYMTVRRSVAQEMADKRGYDDIVAEDVWNQWQIIRQSLSQ